MLREYTVNSYITSLHIMDTDIVLVDSNNTSQTYVSGKAYSVGGKFKLKLPHKIKHYFHKLLSYFVSEKYCG